MSKDVKNKIFWGLLVGLSLLSLSQTESFREWLGVFPSGNDGSVFFTVARAMFSHGLVPYVDLFDHKGPLIYFLDYIALELGGEKMVLLLEFLSVFIVFYIFTLTSQLFASKKNSLLSLSFLGWLILQYIAAGNLPEFFAFPAIMYGYYGLAKIAKGESLNFGTSVGLGFSFAWVLWLKFNLIVVFGVIFCAWVVYACYQHRLRDTPNVIFGGIIGICLVSLPILFYLCSHKALVECWNDYVLFNLEYSGKKGLDSLLKCIIVRLCEHKEILFPFAVLGIYNYTNGITKNPSFRFAILLLLTLCLYFPALLSGKLIYNQYFFPFCPIYALILALGIEEMAYVRFNRMILILITLLYGTELFCNLRSFIFQSQNQWFAQHDADLLKVLDASKDRRILFYDGTCATGKWYRLYNAVPSCKYFYHPPVEFNTERQKVFIQCFAPEVSNLIFIPKGTELPAEIKTILENGFREENTISGNIYISKHGGCQW